jgi:copper resistance protein D
MEGIADFLDALLGGIDLTSLALAVGSICWGLFILKPWRRYRNDEAVIVHICVKIIYMGSFTLASVQLIEVAVKAWLIAETLGRSPFPAFADTIQFQAGLSRALFALLLALFARLSLKRNPHSSAHWSIALYLVVPLVVSGAWLVHGAGRFDYRVALMALTVLHQLGAAIWLGGIAQLLGIWRLKQHNSAIADLWPALLARFSSLGFAAILLLLTSGIPLAWTYINSWTGLFGTGYGNLLVVKIWLFLIVLGFAMLNYRAAKRCRAFGFCADVNQRVPYYIEAETFVLIGILFTAASLSSQPPPVDIPDLTASWSEVINTFTPRIPRFTSPTHDALIAGEAGRTAIVAQTPSIAATEWSNYNHNMAGIFLFVISIVGLLSYDKRFPWAKSWPLGFVALSIFLFFRADAETWPMGPIGFWESTFSNGEVLQHRLATLLAFALGVFEYRARRIKDPNSRLPYIFPILVAFGGLMLLTHSHVGFQAKTEFLIQIGHTTMGLLAIVMACGRWLELRLEPPIGRAAGLASMLAMVLISLLLMFYREPLY